MDEMSLPPQIMAILRALGLNSNADAFMQIAKEPHEPYLRMPPYERPQERVYQRVGPGTAQPMQPHPGGGLDPQKQAVLDMIKEIGGLGPDMGGPPDPGMKAGIGAMRDDMGGIGPDPGMAGFPPGLMQMLQRIRQGELPPGAEAGARRRFP